ncbi:hypothetical protein KCP71_21680 [Salmonella enterica subsp. enterica]|nr:hypothetical protein KCP71_21680 [Salmonella enterica subsp. enterica]
MKTGDEQQQTPRRERSRRRNDDKRRGAAGNKRLTREEQPVEETGRKNAFSGFSRAASSALNQKVRFAPTAQWLKKRLTRRSSTNHARLKTLNSRSSAAYRVGESWLPVVADIALTGWCGVEPRDNIPVCPRRSRRSPRRLRVSGQRRRRYRDGALPIYNRRYRR